MRINQNQRKAKNFPKNIQSIIIFLWSLLKIRYSVIIFSVSPLKIQFALMNQYYRDLHSQDDKSSSVFPKSDNYIQDNIFFMFFFKQITHPNRPLIDSFEIILMFSEGSMIKLAFDVFIILNLFLCPFIIIFMTEIAPNIDINQAIQASKFPQDNIQTSPELDAKQIEPESQRKFTTTELPKQETPSQKKQKLDQPKLSKSRKIAIGIAVFIFVGMVISFILFFLVSLRPEIKSSSNTQEGKLDDGSTLAVKDFILEIKSLAGPNQKYQVIHTEAVSLQKNKPQSAFSDTINLKDQGILVNISPNSTIKVGILLEKFTDYVTKNAKNKNLQSEKQNDNKTLEQKLASKINDSVNQKFKFDGKLIDLENDQNSFCFDRDSKQYRQCIELKNSKRTLFSFQSLPNDIGQELLSSLVNKISISVAAVQQFFQASDSEQINHQPHQFQQHCFAQTSEKFICHH